MTLVNSGNPISMGGSTTGQSINLELGQSATAQISLNDTNARALAGITTPGAQISLYNFYGKSSVTIYHSWTGGLDGSSYDNSYGDTTTATMIPATEPDNYGQPQNYAIGTIYCSSSRTGMTSVALKVRATWTIGVGTGGDPPGPVTGSVAMMYSWDGSSWYYVFSDSSDNSSTAEQSYSLGNFTSGTNLNALRVAFIHNAGGSYDSGKGSWDTVFSSFSVYDVAVAVA